METTICDVTIDEMADWILSTPRGDEDRKSLIKMVATDKGRTVGAEEIQDKYGHKPKLQGMFSKLRIDAGSERATQVRLSALREAMVNLRKRDEFSGDVEKYLEEVRLHDDMIDELSEWLVKVHGSSVLAAIVAVDVSQREAAATIHGRYYTSIPVLRAILGSGLEPAELQDEAVRLSVIRESLVKLREGKLRSKVDSSIATKLSDSRRSPAPSVMKNEAVSA